LKEIKVGLIGAGQVAKAHAVALASSGVLFGTNYRTSLSVLAEATPELAKSASARLGFLESTSDWKQLTRSDNVELVDIVTPTHLHSDQAIDALEHGKTVLCEKPLSTSSREARRMYDAARKSGKLNMVGFNYRRLPAVALCKKMIESGELGKILHFRCSFMEDWGGNPDLPLTWRFQLEKAGAGALADLGSHALDLCRFLCGDIGSVCATQARYIDERPLPPDGRRRGKVDVDDATMCLIEFKNGVLGRMETSWASTGRRVALEFEVTGAEGSAHYNLEQTNELHVFSKMSGASGMEGYRTLLMGPLHPYGTGIVFPAPGCGMGYEESLVNEIHDLLSAMTDGGTVSPTFYDGLQVNLAIEAIQRSAREESWVDLT
jgi:predicted dehydrogenase